MGANDRALKYARDRLAAALEVLAFFETHHPVTQRLYNDQLRRALALDPSVRLTCSCAMCRP